MFQFQTHIQFAVHFPINLMIQTTYKKIYNKPTYYPIFLTCCLPTVILFNIFPRFRQVSQQVKCHLPISISTSKIQIRSRTRHKINMVTLFKSLFSKKSNSSHSCPNSGVGNSKGVITLPSPDHPQLKF